LYPVEEESTQDQNPIALALEDGFGVTILFRHAASRTFALWQVFKLLVDLQQQEKHKQNPIPSSPTCRLKKKIIYKNQTPKVIFFFIPSSPIHILENFLINNNKKTKVFFSIPSSPCIYGVLGIR
jgi:hypothetical protein